MINGKLMSSNRRRFKRFAMHALVKWKPISANPGYTPSYPAIIKDISPQGVLIASFTKINTGDNIRLEVKLPTGAVVDFVGQAKWVLEAAAHGRLDRNRYDVGIQIVDISPLNLKHLNEFTFFHFFDLNTLLDASDSL